MEPRPRWFSIFAQERPGAPETLAPLLDERLRAAWSAWPDLKVSTEEFVRFLARRLPDDAELASALETCHITDLYLAYGCAHGDERAIALFDGQLLTQVRTWVRRIDSSKAFADEVTQSLRERLLIGGPERAPRIADFSGHGPLAHWLKIVSLRAALDLQRRHGAPADSLGDHAVVSGNPELAYLRESARREFQAAMRESIAELSVRERNLLRLHYVDGLATPEIAVLFHTHRTTIRRHLNECQTRLLNDVRERLGRRLKISESEIESLIRAAKTGIELSLSILESSES
jgi:RNA polymerase sigma-70 factor (ECF subfamily)